MVRTLLPTKRKNQIVALFLKTRSTRSTLRTVRPHALPGALTGTLTETASRALEGLLTLASFATTPLAPTDYLSLIDPLHLSKELRGRVVARRQETAEAATLVIRPGRGWRPHIPGQYVRIGVDVDGVRHWRAYSITSRVGTPDGCIAITVKKVADGHVSAYLVDEIRPGTLLMLNQATGDFVMPKALPAKVLFLTAGSGLTPVMGMLRNDGTALADVVLLHSAPTSDDVIFGDELREMAAMEELTFIERHTALDGKVDVTTELDRLVPDWRERHTWACGPGAMLDACHELWEGEGLASLLHTERFRPKVASVGEGGQVTFGASGMVVEADGRTPILDAGEEAGVLMPSGCRMGICFGCSAPLVEGSVRDLRTGALTTAAPQDGIVVQTCINAAAGPCTIEL